MNMNLLEKTVTVQRKEPDIKKLDELQGPICWVEKSGNLISQRFWFDPRQNAHLSVKVLDETRPAFKKVTESFLNTFFPSGYPYMKDLFNFVNEGYLRYTQFRALQHFTSATLSVLSTQALVELLETRSSATLDLYRRN